MDSNKPAQNIQDSFLNTARKERLSITIYLLSGVKLTGRIRSFDKYSVVLEANGQEQLIFKHAISTVVMGRVMATHVAHVAHPEKAVAPSTTASRQRGSERFGHRRIRNEKAFSVWEVLIARNPAARRVLCQTCASGSEVGPPGTGARTRVSGRRGSTHARTQRRKGTVTAQASAARDAAGDAARETWDADWAAAGQISPTASPAFPSSMPTSRWPNCARWPRVPAPK